MGCWVECHESCERELVEINGGVVKVMSIPTRKENLAISYSGQVNEGNFLTA